MLKSPLFRKLLVIACIVFLLSLVLFWIKGLVREREGYQRDAVQKVAQSHAGQQVLTGPILVIPYTEHYTLARYDDKGNFLRNERAKKELELLVFPVKSETQGKFEVHTRSVGIHDVRVYGLKGSMTGLFPAVSQAQLTKTQSGSDIVIGQPRIMLGLSDIRGFHSTPKLVLDQATLLAQPGTEHEVIAKGVHFDLPTHAALDKPQAFTLSLDLIGMEQFSLVPIANDNFVKFDSPWAHPSFGGDFLPRADQKVVTDQGFSAGWSVPSLATNVQTQIRKANQPNVHLQTISLGFIEPINIYSLGWRASEYGLLFVLAAFVTFFLFETLKRLRIHPVQYTLVGLAQAVFFLLLLALSEQVAFVWAYMGAAAACLALLTLYLSHVLQSIWRAFSATGVFAGLYALLYQILNSEDKAFLMGAILVFAGLAATMLVTRKVNWFELSKAEALS